MTIELLYEIESVFDLQIPDEDFGGLVTIGKGAEAVPHLEAALPTDGDGTIHFQLARAYQMSGRTDEAKKMMAKSQQMRSADAAQRAQLEEEMRITGP